MLLSEAINEGMQLGEAICFGIVGLVLLALVTISDKKYRRK